MEGLKMIPYLALVIAIAGIIIGAAAISVNKFQTSMDNSGCFNSSYVFRNDGTCSCNASSTAAFGEGGTDNMSIEGYSACQAGSAQADLGEQLPTVAIISIMVVIISIIAGVFVYMRYFA